MRLGRVQFNIGYVVNLDDGDMVQHAKDAIADDITNAARDGVFCDIIHKDSHDEMSEGDIPEFLWDDGENYVIYSDKEKLFWSNEDGWVDRESATSFDGCERSTLDLPEPDGRWMNTRIAEMRQANPDNDEFNCVECKKCFDIEDSIEGNDKELFCPDCAEERGYYDSESI